MDSLKEKQLLPILQFTENLLRVITDYKHKFQLEIDYDSEERTVTYKFDISMPLGNYKAELFVYYDEVFGEKNDWENLKQQVSHIQQIITT